MHRFYTTICKHNHLKKAEEKVERKVERIKVLREIETEAAKEDQKRNRLKAKTLNTIFKSRARKQLMK